MSVAKFHYVLAHGLNVHPSAMERLAEALSLPPDHCTYICLPGHQRGESVDRTTASQWLDSFGAQYQQVFQQHSRIFYLGYSLSGLLMTHLLATNRISAPERQILFAPALAFRRWTQIPARLPTSLFDRILIPSFTPKQYKANPGVTIGAYKVLFSIYSQLEQLDSAPYNVPSLVLCDERDELIYPYGLRKFVFEKQLMQWKLYIASSGLWERWGRKHLLVAPEYQPEAYWNQLRKRINDFMYA